MAQKSTNKIIMLAQITITAWPRNPSQVV